MSIKRVVIATILAGSFPSFAYAQQRESASPPLRDFLWAFVPLLILLIIFLFVLFLIVRWAQSGPRARRAEQYMLNHEQHMQRVEQTLERIAKALEKRDTNVV